MRTDKKQTAASAGGTRRGQGNEPPQDSRRPASSQAPDGTRGRELARVEKGSADLTAYDQKQYNVLSPVEIVRPESAEYIRESVAIVRLDPDTEKGDCYAAPGTTWSRGPDGPRPDKLAPAKPGLFKLASAMGIRWRIVQIKPRSHTLLAELAAGAGPAAIQALFDQVKYDVAYRAQIAIRDGLTWRFLEATYEWELESQERKIRSEAKNARTRHATAKANYASGKWKKRPANFADEFDEDAYVADRLDQVISNRHALAETKAVLRAVRATGIRHQYTREEFARPFVMQRVELAPDMSDPAVRAAIAQKAVSSGSDLFGSSPTPTPALPERAALSVEVPDFAGAEDAGHIEHVAPVNGEVVEHELPFEEADPGPSAEPPEQAEQAAPPPAQPDEAPIGCEACAKPLPYARIVWCESDDGKAMLKGKGRYLCSTCQQTVPAQSGGGRQK